jgi:hypothetical protein
METRLGLEHLDAWKPKAARGVGYCRRNPNKEAFHDFLSVLTSSIGIDPPQTRIGIT